MCDAVAGAGACWELRAEACLRGGCRCEQCTVVDMWAIFGMLQDIGLFIFNLSSVFCFHMLFLIIFIVLIMQHITVFF